MAKVKKKKESAGARIARGGRSLVWATFSADEKQKVRVAAALEGIPMSQFLTHHGLIAAEKVLANRQKSS